MPLLAEVVDAVVGGDTHRDTHTLELTAPTGATISTLTVANDEDGFATVIAWITEHAPGPRVVVGLEGTRSYGIGLSRAVQAAGLVVVEVERPKRSDRRRGKSDPIDARLAALHTLRLDADRLPTPRADGTARPCESCSVLAASSPRPAPARSTASDRCCSPATK